MPSLAPPNSVATGTPGDLPGDVPQRRLERPVPAGVEVDGLEDADVMRDVERVLPDEQVLERLEPVHRVTGPDADHALVGLDADDRDREARARHGIPGRREGRVERDDETEQPDRADPHGPSIADRLAHAASSTRCGTLTAPPVQPPESPVTTALDRPPEEAGEDTSFARGLRVFLTVADRGEIRADELSTLLDTPLSTIYRYLRTLTEFGFVERQEGGYRLGSATARDRRRADRDGRGADPRR